MDSKSINRIEKKYLITTDDKEAFLKQIKKHMKKDGYYISEVHNLYFDTDNYDLIIKSIDQPIFKEKVRARSYAGYDRVFLEIKTKYRQSDNNVGYKRRVMITHSEFKEFVKKKKTLEELAKNNIEKEDDIQIAKEVDYLMEHFDLKPRIMVIYSRESYKGEDNLRITFDENLRYETKSLSFDSKKRGKMYFKDKHNIIMEVKAHGVLPLWLVHTMSERKAFPTQFSKVGMIYEKKRKVQNV